jgi:hypothetical protein
MIAKSLFMKILLLVLLFSKWFIFAQEDKILTFENGLVRSRLVDSKSETVVL